MAYIAYAIAVLLILYTLGLGITLLLLPSNVRQYSLLVAPWIGYSYVALICFWVYEFGGRITSLVADLIPLPPIICLVIVLLNNRLTVRLKTAVGDRRVLWTLLLAAAAFLVISIPVIEHSYRATTVSLFNHDVAAYATVSRFYMDFTRTSSMGFVGQAFDYLNRYAGDGYFGVVSFTAFVGAVLGIMPHETTTLCINLLAMLGAANLCLILADILKLRTKMVLLGTALFAFHPAFCYIVLQGFFGQSVAMGIAVLIFWTHCKLIEASRNGGLYVTRYLLLLVCFISGLLVTYQHMLLFVWFFAGVYSAWLAFSKRDKRILWVSALAHLGAILMSAALFPARAIAYLDYLRWVGTVEGGWTMPFFSPDYLAGLSYQNSPFAIENQQFHLIGAIAIGAIALALLFISWRRAGAPTRALWIGCTAIYLVAVLVFLRDPNGPTAGYKSFKVASFFLVFFAAAAASLFNIVPERGRRLSLLLKGVILLGLSFAYVRADARLQQAMHTAGKWVGPQYDTLLSIDKDDRIQSVNVLGQNGWENMWSVYFLMHKKVYCEGPTYWGNPRLEAAYDLVDTETNEPMRHLPEGRIPNIRRLNDRFYLIGPIPE